MKSLKAKIQTGTCMGVAALSLSQVSGLNAMWAAGKATNQQIVSALSNAVIGSLPGGGAANKSQAIITAIKHLVAKGSAAFSGNWYDLCWTVTDIAISCVPAATAARIMYQVVKVIPML